MTLAANRAAFGNGSRLSRGLKALVLNIRNLSTRPNGKESTRFSESRRSTGSGVEYDLYQPAVAIRSPFVVLQGLTLQGERDPRLTNFSRALAESGIPAAAVALPELKACRFDKADVDTIIDLVTELSSASGQKIGMIGFSFGAGLALVAAADERISGIVDPLLLFGPYYSLLDLRDMILEQTNVHPRNDEQWDDYIWIRMVLAYRAIDSLELEDNDRRELVELLTNFCHEPSLRHKMQFYRRVLKDMDIEPLCFQFVENKVIAELSPRDKLASVTGRVLILHDEYDNLIPPGQSEKIMEELRSRREGATQRLLVTPILSHVMLRSVWKFFDVFRIMDIMGEIFR
jgi:pimeloyl-ACP methyl ester carboxylesterase